MFEKEVYMKRRKALVEKMRAQGATGIAVFLGNNEAAMNYANNAFPFRQDSCFLYFWGLNEPHLAATINIENGKECLYGDDVSIDDIIWMGWAEAVADKAARIGVDRHSCYADFNKAVQFAVQNDVPVHFLPSGRWFNRLKMAELTGTDPNLVYKTAAYDDEDYIHSSLELTKAVIELRLQKEQCEIERIDQACDLGVQMHDIGRRMCKVGALEKDIAGAMDGFAGTKGWGVAFATILSQNGQILHGHDHSLTITDGRLLLIDAGVAFDDGYCSDFTRTIPCSGKFSTMQKEIYDIVLGCNEKAAELAAPGVKYIDVHNEICREILTGVKALGLVTGDVDEMLELGISGMFMPHGLGHNMGLDVHDMEDLDENLVGYDPGQMRSNKFGSGNLRMARALKPGNVITDEPGIYFIPALWKYFKEHDMDKGMVNFQALEKYKDFGGIRLEDDLLVTESGCRRMGSSRLPITTEDIEHDMNL